MSEVPSGLTLWNAVTALVGVIQGGLAFVHTLLWSRMATLEARVEANANRAREEAAKGDQDIWKALNETSARINDTNDRLADAHAELLRALREVPTKSDLRDMEGRLNARLVKHP